MLKLDFTNILVILQKKHKQTRSIIHNWTFYITRTSIFLYKKMHLKEFIELGNKIINYYKCLFLF